MKDGIDVFLIAVIAFGLFFAVLVLLGVSKQKEEHEKITDNCEITNMYTIGYRGRVSRIYDCSNNEMRAR